MKEKLNLLVFAAHPDDAELGCGGILAKHASMGWRVGIVDLTEGQLSTRGTVEDRRKEAAESAHILGLSARHNLGFEDGFFVNDSAHREKMIEQIRRFQPDIVLCNAPSDRHPDHGRAATMALEACFYTGLSKIETTWDGVPQDPWRPKAVYHFIQFYDLTPSFLVDITGFEQQKLAAIQSFKSQFYNPTSEEPTTLISTKAFMDSLLHRTAEWGLQMGVSHAEGLISVRITGLQSLHALL